MNDYDQAARYTAKIDPTGFLRWLLPGLPPHIIFHRWLDTRTLPLPGEPDRTCDTVAELLDRSNPGSASALVLEFQSTPDVHMMDRLLEYVSRARRELRHGPGRKQKYQVSSALLNLTGPRQPDFLEMGLPGAPDVGLQFRTAVRTMREEDAGLTLESIKAGVTALCILPWVPLMRGAGKRGMIEQWKEAAGRESNIQLRSTYAGLALVFAELAGRGKLWRQGLRGWESQPLSMSGALKAVQKGSKQHCSGCCSADFSRIYRRTWLRRWRGSRIWINSPRGLMLPSRFPLRKSFGRL